MENSESLDQLFDSGGIRLERGDIFQRSLSPKSRSFDFGRVEGMLLGIAIGDALGVTTEGMRPSERRQAHGEIRDYIPNRHSPALRGFPSDDTQLSFWTLAQLIEDQKLVPEHLATRFSRSGQIYGIGSTVKTFLRNQASGKPWYECGPESAGNGALMRIAPVLIPHLQLGGTDLWADTALAAMVTHNDHASTSSCLAFIAMLWDLLDMNTPPDRGWWIERYVQVTHDLEGDARYTPRGGAYRTYRGPLWRFVQEKLSWADSQGLRVIEACNGWYSGAFLLETVPSALYILMHHAHDPEEAIIRAVNDTKDNDTIAAIVGAAIGALHGREGLPDRWVENLSGRTTERDDGRVFELINQARDRFFSA